MTSKFFRLLLCFVCSLSILFSLSFSVLAADSPLDYVGMTGQDFGYDFAWCAKFANDIVSEFCPERDVCTLLYVPSHFEYYHAKGYTYTEKYIPSDFDFVYFDFDNDSSLDHVGIWYQGGVLEGNYNDSVAYNHYDISDSRIYGFAHAPVISRVVSPVSPSNSSGLKSTILSLIGDYDAIIVEYAYQSSNGYTSYIREVQIDYPWICSVCVFALVLFCVFRLIGVLFKRGGYI